jgi:ketosteroid isomerase-like protein
MQKGRNAMTGHKWFAFVVVIGCAFAWPSWVNGQDESAAVAQALSDYYRAFSAYDTQRALSYYNEPVVFIAAQSVIAAATPSESATRLTKLYEILKPTGFARSELTNVHIKQMSAGLAIASGVAVRYKADGTELGRFGVTYILRKTAEGWKLAALVSHDTATALRLD